MGASYQRMMLRPTLVHLNGAAELAGLSMSPSRLHMPMYTQANWQGVECSLCCEPPNAASLHLQA